MLCHECNEYIEDSDPRVHLVTDNPQLLLDEVKLLRIQSARQLYQIHQSMVKELELMKQQILDEQQLKLKQTVEDIVTQLKSKKDTHKKTVYVR